MEVGGAPGVRARLAGGALALVLTASLTGCFANPLDAIVDTVAEESTKGTAEDIIEGITGGEVDVEFGELPDGFPPEVPLVSENVVQSVSTADGMMVTVSDPRSVAELTAQVKEDFAAWEQVMWSEQTGMVVGMFKKSEALAVNVGIMAGGDGEDATIGYTIITPGDAS